MAIDRPKDTDVAVSQNGEVITYDGFLTPNEIQTDVETREKDLLSSENERSIEVQSGDEIMLDYSNTLEISERKDEDQVLLIDINSKCSVPDISVNSGSTWNEVDSFLPRSNGGIQAIDLTGERETNQIQKVKLRFNGQHEIDSLGLADITDRNYKIQELNQVSLESTEASQLKRKDTYTKLTPEDKGITLNYEIPEK